MLADGRRLYVNRGLGHTVPIRVDVRPEITLFTPAMLPAADPGYVLITAAAAGLSAWAAWLLRRAPGP